MTIEKPFDSIALCLSGGGYRAAAFHLGTLAYLERVKFNGKPLIDSATIISTISGGTFTGLLYAQCVVHKTSFQAFYDLLYDFMHQKDLIDDALRLLNDDQAWDGYKQRNLINAFSIIYQRDLFKDESFGIFKNLTSETLDTIIVNCTEFNHGLSFRFQNNGIVGNNYVNVPDRELSEKSLEEVRLGDILAASSCFPGGFEPILFPHDFIGNDSKALKEIKKTYFPGGAKDLSERFLFDPGLDFLFSFRQIHR